MSELQRQFLSHPDVGTLSSITDTLTDFNVANQAVQIDTASLKKLSEPFVAFVKNEQVEQFVLVFPTPNISFSIYNGEDKTFILSFNEFTTIFDGIIIAIEKQEKTSNNYSQFVHFIIPTSLIVSFCVIFLIQIPYEINTVLFATLTLAGLTFSALLFAHTLGVKNDILNRFCTISKSSSCNSVLQSDAAKINKYLSLTDVGIIYFSFQLISQLIFKQDNSSLYAIGIVAASFSFYSVYQQAFVIKKWCPLCLGVVLVLLLQGVIGFFNFNTNAINTIQIISLFFLLFLTSIGWHYFKNIFIKSRKLYQTQIDLLSFKRNYHLFLPFYKSEIPVDTNVIDIQEQVIIGNESAPVCITLITNPLCEACQKAHKLLTELYNQYQKQIAIRFIFYVPYQNLNDPRTMIAGWLVEEYLNDRIKGIKAIENWYKKPDLNALDKLRLQIDVVKNQQFYLKTQSEWCVEQRLTLTPLLLINNKLFPLIYRTEDLRFHIEAIIEYEQTKEYESKKSFQSTKVLVDNT
ncbi:MAG: thioredoxin domain-containing protein [Chitinophagaceae bacterium]|nr:thioredoxin domain-containing protein [Chitinophagaceae bacterium]